MDDIKNESMELIITDIAGSIHRYYIICRFHAMNKEYIALAPQSGSNAIELFRCFEDNEGKIGVTDIVSDMELESVISAYRKINENEVDELLIEDGKDTTIVIRRDDGTECICNIVSLFEYDSKDYIALMPLEPINGSGIDGVEDSMREVQLQIVLYGYSAHDDNKGNATISLLPIPIGHYPNIEARFMDMVMESSEGIFSENS